jgi:hypothetical protein
VIPPGAEPVDRDRLPPGGSPRPSREANRSGKSKRRPVSPAPGFLGRKYYAGALADYDRALEIRPRFCAAYISRGNARYQEPGKARGRGAGVSCGMPGSRRPTSDSGSPSGSTWGRLPSPRVAPWAEFRRPVGPGSRCEPVCGGRNGRGSQAQGETLGPRQPHHKRPERPQDRSDAYTFSACREPERRRSAARQIGGRAGAVVHRPRARPGPPIDPTLSPEIRLQVRPSSRSWR